MTKETKEPKARVNGIKEGVWSADGKTLTYTFIHGSTLVVQRDRMAAPIIEGMFRHGIEARIGDKGAVEAKDFPDRFDRSREAERRMRALVEHYHSGTTDWDMRTGAVGPRVRMDLIHRAMVELKLAESEAVAEGLVANLAKVRSIELAAAYKLFQDSKDVGAKVREYLDAEKTYTGSASEMLADLKKAAG